MRTADMEIGGVYAAKEQYSNRYEVEMGLKAVPVILIGKGRYTTVQQPCGLIMAESDAVKSDRWVAAEPFFKSDDYEQNAVPRIKAGRYSFGGNVIHPTTEWRPRFVTPSSLVMTWGEFLVKREAAWEIDAILSRDLKEQDRLISWRDACVKHALRRLDIEVDPLNNTGITVHGGKAMLPYAVLADLIGKITDRAGVEAYDLMMDADDAQQDLDRVNARLECR